MARRKEERLPIGPLEEYLSAHIARHKGWHVPVGSGTFAEHLGLPRRAWARFRSEGIRVSRAEEICCHHLGIPAVTVWGAALLVAIDELVVQAEGQEDPMDDDFTTERGAAKRFGYVKFPTGRKFHEISNKNRTQTECGASIVWTDDLFVAIPLIGQPCASCVAARAARMVAIKSKLAEQ